MSTLMLCYIVGISIVAFLAFGLDKQKAKAGQWRIPETTLLLLAIVGGSIGAWLGMKVWCHKTMHPRFKYGIPVIVFLQMLLFPHISAMLS